MAEQTAFSSSEGNRREHNHVLMELFLDWRPQKNLCGEKKHSTPTYTIGWTFGSFHPNKRRKRFKCFLVKSISPHWAEENGSGMLVPVVSVYKGRRRKGLSLCQPITFCSWKDLKLGFSYQTLASILLNHKLLCLFLSSNIWVASSLSNKSGSSSGGTQAGPVPAGMWLITDIFLVTAYVAYSADWNVYIECFSSLKITMVMVPKTKALAFCHG